MTPQTRGTLRTRISLLLGMASAFSLIIVVGVLFNLSRNIGTVIDALEREEQIQLIGSKITLSMVQNFSRAFAAITTGSGELHPGFSAECVEIRRWIEDHQKLDLEADDLATVELIKEKHQDLEAKILYVSFARRIEPGLDLTGQTDRIMELAGELDQLVGGLAITGNERIRTQLEDLRRWEESATNWIIGGGIISVIAFSIIGLLYTRRILSPLDELREATARMSEGEFGIKVPEGSVEEVQQLSSSFNQMADALRESEKRQLTNRLESIGILAGGIAHDFNNFLMAIYGSLTLARREIAPDSPARELLDEAEAASLRAKNLTQQLLTFAKGGRPVKKPVSIRRVVLQAMEFALRGTALRAEYTFPEDLWPAELDEGQVGQVFSNLAINAEQSMPGGGRLDVSAENLKVEERSPLPLSPGPHVRVTVRDHGTGILAEHLARIFDPYYTTKRRGSGLGLAVAQSVITRHGGVIAAESEMGRGSLFHVYLPADPDLELEPALGDGMEQLAGTGRILLMDDEESVRRVTGMLLGDLGYRPETAADGEEALALFRQAMDQEEPFRAVICDLVVPGGMGGADTVKALKAMAPDTPVIAASGYTNDPVLSDFKSFGFDGGLAKPFSIGELGRSLSTLLKR